MDDAPKVILVELQQTAESLGLPFDVGKYAAILNQLIAEYDDESVDVGMATLRFGFLQTYHKARFCGWGCFLVTTKRFPRRIQRM